MGTPSLLSSVALFSSCEVVEAISAVSFLSNVFKVESGLLSIWIFNNDGSVNLAQRGIWGIKML